MNFRKTLSLCCLLFLIVPPSLADEKKKEMKPSRSLQSAKYAVRVSAVVQSDPAQISLQWPKGDCLSYVIYRRAFGKKRWDTTPAAVLKGDAVSFIDKKVKPGLQYEYRVDRFASGYVGRSYLCSGIDLPLVEDRGGVLLLVEKSVAPALNDELARLEMDLTGDGWHVIRREVGRDDSVESVRKVIRGIYQEDKSKLRTLFLFGHIAVPYSGSINPDGHKNHLGAWPADLVYADIDGEWNDKKTHQTFKRGNQENIPGDGKYDKNAIAPNSLELEIGRVDLAEMPAFKLSETELLRRYLNKNHAFRHARVSTKEKGLIDDNFGAFSGEAFGWGGWSNFAAFFGAENTEDKDWFTTLPKTSYLWAYGCGGGSNAKAGGVGNTGEFAEKGSKAVFTMLFGSYFGDWDHPDNFMRAPLAAEGNALTCAWDGRPHWFFHSMALGKNIGYCALRTQANDFYGDYLSPDNTRLTLSGENDDSEWEPNPVHVALMGDPTLRMHPVPPPTDFTSTKTDEGQLLKWKDPTGIDDVSYLIYKASSMDGGFQRVTEDPIKETQFMDRSESVSGTVFMIKSYLKQGSASGSYFNTSQGQFLGSVQEYDMVIRGGRVMDPESGFDAVREVGILNGKIAAISTAALAGKQIIDATGLVVAPGFIDLHQHAWDEQSQRFKVRDGVTSVLELEVGTAEVEKWYEKWQGKLPFNYGVAVGHIPVRMKVMGDFPSFLPKSDSKAATIVASAEQIERLKKGIARGLDQGAVAVGFGIAYTPSATRREILEMFRVAGKYDSACHVHIRERRERSVLGVQEVLADSAISGAALHLVHIQATGANESPALLQMVSDARAQGLDVTAEVYPYTAGMTDIKSSIFAEGWQDTFKIGYNELQWGETGERLTEETFLKYRKTGGLVIVHMNSESIVTQGVTHPAAMIASDGLVGHPRNAGTFARILGFYVRERGELDLMTALRKISLMPAMRLEARVPAMKNKGRIKIGADADLALFDPESVIDRATFSSAKEASDGISYVLVGGVLVVKERAIVEGAFPGKAIRAPQR